MSIVKKILAWIVAKLKALIFGKSETVVLAPMSSKPTPVAAPAVIVTPKS